MPQTHRPHSPEFCRQGVELVGAGRPPEDMARKSGPPAQLIRAWVARAHRPQGRRAETAPGLRAFERDKLARLRREVRQLRVKRNFLPNAVAWFARETGTRPGSSGSRARTSPCFLFQSRRVLARSAYPRRASTPGCTARRPPMPSRMRRC